MARFSWKWPDLARFSWKWPDLAIFGLEMADLARFGLEMARFGLEMARFSLEIPKKMAIFGWENMCKILDFWHPGVGLAPWGSYSGVHPGPVQCKMPLLRSLLTCKVTKVAT